MFIKLLSFFFIISLFGSGTKIINVNTQEMPKPAGEIMQITT